MVNQFRQKFCLGRERKGGVPRCAQILKAILENDFARIIVLDNRSRVVWMNRYKENHSPHEVYGELIYSLSPEPQLAAQMLLKAKKLKRVCTEESMMGFDGVPRSARIVPIEDGWSVIITIPNGLMALSPREKEIKKLCEKGHSVKEIARLLFCSPYTVSAHKKNIKKKIKTS